MSVLETQYKIRNYTGIIVFSTVMLFKLLNNGEDGAVTLGTDMEVFLLTDLYIYKVEVGHMVFVTWPISAFFELASLRCPPGK